MANWAAKNLKFAQNFLIQCILGSFSSFQALVSKLWLSRFEEKIQFIAIIDTRRLADQSSEVILKATKLRDWPKFSDSMYPW